MMTKWKRRILFWLSVSIFALVSVPLAYFSMGYRFSFEEGKILRAGALAISSTPSRNSKIYVDNRLVREVGIIPRNVFLQGLTPRTYAIRIEKDGYITWQKNLQVKSELVTLVKADLITAEPVITAVDSESYISLDERLLDDGLIALTDSAHKSVFYSIDDAQVTYEPITPEERNPLPPNIVEILETTTPLGYDYSPENSRIIWWTNHQVWISWLDGEDFLPLYTDQTVLLLFETSSFIRRAQFLPGTETFLIALDSAIFDLELDGRGSRNMFSVYEGTSPDFFALDKKTLLVLDDNHLFTVGL